MSNKVDIYNLIVETAYKMFSKNGFEKTSLSMIAKEVEFRSQHSKDKIINVLFEEICKKSNFHILLHFKNINAEGFKQFMLSIGYQMIVEQEIDD
ncbi:hypothetical protein [Bacillus chungangensis]|uniref:Uncharacterized protein n=1 Tax=Bacillus chungangensis TaxID=587633 RepID=A0ABT9WX60_9BACI|nr:hypothetical protein [Bacillus chungangensis]MDQ0177824.1 hypothetical protein [Bacillus chungangensis]